jgi:hypothetical protein
VNAQKDQRTRPATNAVKSDTSPAIAPTQLLKVLAQVLDVELVAEDPTKSATSAPKSATLHETAPSKATATKADSVAVKVDSVETKAAMEAVVNEAKPATHAVVMAT